MLPSAFVARSHSTEKDSENIYEEVHSPVNPGHRPSHVSSEVAGKDRYCSANFRKSYCEEVMYEVEQVQKQHAQVLQELSLEMEKLIMPSVPSPPSSPSVSCIADSSNHVVQDIPAGGTEQCVHRTPPVGHVRHSSLMAVGPAPSSRGNPAWASAKQESLKLANAVTSTPVAKRKWFKSAGKLNNKDVEEEQDHAYSDESIYEDIEQHLCRSNTLRSLGDELFERPFYKDAEAFSDKTDNEKATAVSLSSIKHKLRSVRQRMSKGKGKEERWNLLSKLRETGTANEKNAVRNFANHEIGDPGFPTEIPILRPPCLPPLPKGLALERVKRRCIISTLIESENAYFMTLKRLLHHYKKPLEESHPPLLSKMKINTLFYRLPEIQQCHAMFRIALADCVHQWDNEEKIGDVFVASFSKSMVLDVYSDFINNFSTAMELAKTEAKRKPAFGEFLKLKQVTSPDHLTFFGLMVKPVQRFPQFILLLQDLLRHTPCGHVDRMSLQLALTQLENLTETLNERKRESEQQHTVKELLQRMNAKISLKLPDDCNLMLIREENVALLKLDRERQVVRKKQRRLILLNNFLICVSVNAAQPGSSNSDSDHYVLKWAFPLTDVEVQEELSPVLNHMLLGSGWGKINSKDFTEGNENEVHALSQEMANLMHDFEAISRIAALISTLKQPYPDLGETVQRHLQSIVQKVQTKDREMQAIDNRCLQLQLPIRSKHSKDLVIFQTSGTSSVRDWMTDIRLSKLTLDYRNCPAWHVSEPESTLSMKMPLFAQTLSLMQANFATEVKATCFYVHHSKQGNGRIYKYLWVCSSDGVNSHIRILHIQPGNIRNVVAFEMSEVCISTMEAVPGLAAVAYSNSFDGWTVWMGTDSRKIIMFSANEPEHHKNLGSISTMAPVLQLRYHKYRMFAALSNGTVMMYVCSSDGKWQTKTGQNIALGSEPVTYLLTHDDKVYCSCGRKLYILDSTTGEIKKSFPVHNEQPGNVYLLAQSGIGLWINLRNTATICLYHMENFQHLQDFNITANVHKMLAHKSQSLSPRCIFVTSLMACRGLLWVGTNVGIVLTIPLPRLEGIPIVSGHAATSYHALNGPVTVLANLSMWHHTLNANLKQGFETCQGSPYLLQKTKNVPNEITKSNTLPFANHKNDNNFHVLNSSIGSSSSLEEPALQEKCDVYGLYGDLLKANSFSESQDNIYESLHNTDPEFFPNTAPSCESRCPPTSRRPKSLDLTNVPVHDKTDLSSSSEDSSSTQSFFSIPETIPQLPFSSSAGPCTVDVASTASKAAITSKTVTVIMGGRGYQNIQKRIDSTQKMPTENSLNSAHIVFWETRI